MKNKRKLISLKALILSEFLLLSMVTPVNAKPYFEDNYIRKILAGLETNSIDRLECSITDAEETQMSQIEERIQSLLTDKEYQEFLRNDFPENCPKERFQYRQKVLQKILDLSENKTSLIKQEEGKSEQDKSWNATWNYVQRNLSNTEFKPFSRFEPKHQNQDINSSLFANIKKTIIEQDKNMTLEVQRQRIPKRKPGRIPERKSEQNSNCDELLCPTSGTVEISSRQLLDIKYRCSVTENQKKKIVLLEQEIKSLLTPEEIEHFLSNDFSESCPRKQLKYREKVLIKIKFLKNAKDKNFLVHFLFCLF